MAQVQEVFLFQPTSITGCRLWLDGADSTTITTVTGVSQWNDKSGNAYNLTQGSTGSQPTRTGNLLNFVSNYYLNIPQAAVNNLSTWSIFFAINPISSTNWIMAKQKDGVNTYNVLSMTNNTTNGGTLQTGSTGFLYWRSLNNAGQLVSTGAITTSILQIWNLTFDGTNLYFYKNGVLERTSAGVFAISNDTSATNFTLGVWIQSATIINSGVTNFRLGEMLVYTTGLATSQRQQIEGYLAWKWGLQANLPSDNPFKTYRPLAQTPIPTQIVPMPTRGQTIQAFAPTQISGCQLWLDGADPAGSGILPANGDTVSTWIDKSGNGFNATAAPSRTAGTYSTSFRAVNFPTSTKGYITNYTAAPTNETMFVVFNNPSPSSSNNILIGGVGGARSLGAGHSNPGGTGSVGNLNTQVAWLASTGAGTYTSGTTVITTSQFTTSTNTISLNGGTTASGGAPGFTAGRVTYLGVDATNGGYYYVGYAMEIIFYNSVLNTTQRQQVEGYLAWKWGLVSSLPNGHPYKQQQIAPFPFRITPFRGSLNQWQPTQISGCQLWLDGADPGGTGILPANGATISTWNDKSGNARNSPANTTGAVFAANSLNARGSVNFTTRGQYYVSPNFVPSSTNSPSIFVVARQTGYTGNNSEILIPTVGTPTYATFDLFGELGSFIAKLNMYNNTSQNGGISISSPAIISVVGSGDPSYSASMFGNGTLNVTFTGSGTNPMSVSMGFYIGAVSGFIGNIYDVIMYNTAFSTLQRQNVEGYLAWKWGLQGSLPSTHPYKNLPPPPS